MCPEYDIAAAQGCVPRPGVYRSRWSRLFTSGLGPMDRFTIGLQVGNLPHLGSAGCANIKLMLFDASDLSIFDVHSYAAGPVGALPLSAEMLRERPSGDLFGVDSGCGDGGGMLRS